MYTIANTPVSHSDFIAAELAFEEGVPSYIRPVYRNGEHIGFCVYVRGEAIGKVFDQYKWAANLLERIRAGEIE
jgi:predicted ester cyclase